MEFLFLDQIQKRPFFLPFIIAASAAVSLGINVYGLTVGITNVLPHLFYVPIFLSAYYYPKRGPAVALGLSVVYLAFVFFWYAAAESILNSAIARTFVYVIIGSVVSYLSGQLHHDSQMCRRLVSLVASSRDAIIGETLDGIITDWNASAEELFGYSEAEVKGKPVTILLPPDNPDEARHLIEKIRNGYLVERYETERLSKDGRRIQVSLSLSPIKNTEGELNGVSVSAHDITEKKQMQEEIDRFFVVSLDLLCIATTEGVFVRLNPQWEQTLGYPVSELTGKRFLDFVHPEDLPATITAMSALHENKPVLNFVNRYRCSDGTYRWIEWRSYPYRNELIYASARDVTESRRTEEALQQANEKLNMLSSITRHDILNQLTGLRAYLELTRETTDNPETINFLERGERVAEAIGRQIEFTRYYQDIGVHLPQWQDAGGLIDTVAGQIDLCSITLTNAISGIDIFADPLISKVFYNLIENSIRHGEQVSSIAFSSRETAEGLTLSYRDNGVGIPAEDKNKLFQRGFGKHTGLGLFLSREILSITGITVQENGEPGRGVQFEIFIPKGKYRQTGTSSVDENRQVSFRNDTTTSA